MDRVSSWFVARPYRANLVNAVMLSIVLALADSSGLYTIVGGLAVTIMGSIFLWRAIRLSLVRGSKGNLLQLALTWIPGTLALALAVVALHLVNANPSGSLAHGLGVLLFTAEIAMLVLVCADLSPAASPSHGAMGAF